jgi:hypothetical protein
MFRGHDACMRVTTDGDGGWRVSTEIDGRQIGWEHCPTWHLVEQLHRRMQRWLAEAEVAERRVAA